MFFLSIIPALSFILQPSIPRTNDLERYVFQVENSSQALSEGRLYPRWSPNALYGYGAPILHFTPPLPVYVSSIAERFLTGGSVTAVKILISLSFMTGGVASYIFVRNRSGSVFGIVTGILYLYSPYVGLVAPYLAGDLPVMVLVALLPLWLWSAQGLRQQSGRFPIVTSALLSAGLILTKPEGALVGYLMAVVLWFSQRQDVEHSSGWGWLFITILLGIGMASFYWIPALVEASQTEWVTIRHGLPRMITLSSLFDPPHAPDFSILNPQPYFALGYVQIACAAVSALFILRWKRWRTLQATFLGWGVILCCLVALLFQNHTWLLCPIALSLGVGGSGAVWWLEKLRRHEAATVTFIMSLIILSAPILLGTRWSDVPFDGSPSAEVNFERLGFGIASLPDGQPVPTNLADGLPPNQALIRGYSSDYILKIDPGASPTRVQAGVLAHTSHADRFQLYMASPTVLRILTNYFPGWYATFNGVAAELRRSPDGLIDISTADRSGELLVDFGTTTARTVAWLLSWGFLAATLIITFRRPPQESLYEYDGRYILSRNVTRAIAVVATGAFIIFALLILPASPLSDLPNSLIMNTTSGIQLSFRTSEGLEALSFNPFPREVSAGDTFDLTLFWRALRFLPSNFQAQIIFTNIATGEETPISELRHIGGLPAQRWITQRIIIDPYIVSVPPHLLAGEYTLSVNVYSCPNEQCSEENRLEFFNPQGESVGQRMILPNNLVIR